MFLGSEQPVLPLFPFRNVLRLEVVFFWNLCCGMYASHPKDVEATFYETSFRKSYILLNFKNEPFSNRQNPPLVQKGFQTCFCPVYLLIHTPCLKSKSLSFYDIQIAPLLTAERYESFQISIWFQSQGGKELSHHCPRKIIIVDFYFGIIWWVCAFACIMSSFIGQQTKCK